MRRWGAGEGGRRDSSLTLGAAGQRHTPRGLHMLCLCRVVKMCSMWQLFGIAGGLHSRPGLWAGGTLHAKGGQAGFFAHARGRGPAAHTTLIAHASPLLSCCDVQHATVLWHSGGPSLTLGAVGRRHTTR